MFLPIGDNIDRRDFPIVPVLLIFANIIAFALEIRICGDAKESDVEAFFQTWGLVPAELSDGKVIGILTHMFLHGGFSHIIGNMFFLWAFSCSLEISLGRATLFGFYLLFGIAGGLTHAFVDMQSELPLVGASGAIAGLIGAYTVLFGVTGKIRGLLFLWATPIRISIPAWLFGIGWFGLQMFNADADPKGMSGVAWYAHIGGFMAGVVTMLICRRDTQCDVKVDRYGHVSLEAPEALEASLAHDVAEMQAEIEMAVPPQCPYCAEAMDEQNRLADNLARCGSPACQRMIYLEC
jgi:membrane associated rhomboid family serine protease